jgi:hypothetical protein
VKKKGFYEDCTNVGVSEKQEWATCCPAGGSFVPSPRQTPPSDTPVSTPAPPPSTPPWGPTKPQYVSWLAPFVQSANKRRSVLCSIASDLAATSRARALALSGAAEAGCISECKAPQPHSASFASRSNAAPSLDVWLRVHSRPPPGGALVGPPVEAAVAAPGSAEAVVQFLEREKVPMHVALRMIQQAGCLWRTEKADVNPGALLSDGKGFPQCSVQLGIRSNDDLIIHA